jgi:hypothetical protein
VQLQSDRDDILHKGHFTGAMNPETSIAVASSILETVFPLVIASLGLHLHEMLVCNDPEHTLPKKSKSIASMTDEELLAYLEELRVTRSDRYSCSRRVYDGRLERFFSLSITYVFPAKAYQRWGPERPTLRNACDA